MSFESILRCGISRGLNEAPASQEHLELGAPAAVASANCAATRKRPRSPDTIDFPYPPLIRPSDSHGTPRLARQSRARRPISLSLSSSRLRRSSQARENRARKVTQTPLTAKLSSGSDTRYKPAGMCVRAQARRRGRRGSEDWTPGWCVTCRACGAGLADIWSADRAGPTPFGRFEDEARAGEDKLIETPAARHAPKTPGRASASARGLMVYASSARTSMVTPGTRTGASDPEVSRSL